MTPALQKIVEAMVAELAAQESGAGQQGRAPVTGKGGQRWLLDGVFDLEKVARAGLEAIKPPSPLDQLDIAAKGNFAEYALRSAIDAILEEKP